MISAAMQGGICENAPNLRAGWTDFSNMVVGALMAPGLSRCSAVRRLRENQVAMARVHSKSELQNSRFLRVV